MNLVPALRLRMSEEDEYIGTDVTEMGENSMEFPLLMPISTGRKNESDENFKMAGTPATLEP
jgi:hypothetical protein